MNYLLIPYISIKVSLFHFAQCLARILNWHFSNSNFWYRYWHQPNLFIIHQLFFPAFVSYLRVLLFNLFLFPIITANLLINWIALLYCFNCHFKKVILLNLAIIMVRYPKKIIGITVFIIIRMALAITIVTMNIKTATMFTRITFIIITTKLPTN